MSLCATHRMSASPRMLCLLLALAPASALADLLLHDAWIGAVPPTAKVGALYLVLENTSQQTVHLGRTTSADAARIELHQSVHAADRVRMESRETVPIPPGARVDFAITGHHYMVWFDQQPAPAPGARLQFQVEVIGATPLSVAAEVRRPAGTSVNAVQQQGPAGHPHEHAPIDDANVHDHH